MADENVPAPAPTRSDDQIHPFAAWVPIGKSNFVLGLQKKQKNPIFHIYVDILQNTNFFRAFTALASGIITGINVDYAELMWEEFVQAIQTFLTDKANLGSPTKKGRKDKPHIISYCWFTKLIICHLGRIHNLHQRSKSLLHLAEEDLHLGNLKFVPKCEDDEVFGMPIPNELITNNIRNVPYYNTYMEMIAKHDLKIAAEKGGKKKPANAKQLKPKPAKEKSSKPAPAPKPKVTKEKPSKPSPAKHPKRDAEIGTDTNKTNNGGDTKILQIGEEQGNDVANMVNLEEKAAEIDEGQAGSDPDPGESRVALARPNPKPTHEEFMANVYPNVHEILKFPADEHVILEDPLSLTGTLYSMKNLDDAYNIGDHSTTIHIGPYFEQPVEDVPMPDTAHISDSEDTDSAYLLKIKPRLEWLKPIPEEDIPATTEPD
ncbi:hypothetical protein Tco_0418083 [Tanacetum coccineum]